MSCARHDSLAVFKVTASDQGQYKGPSGAFVTYCNISCFDLSEGMENCKMSGENQGKVREF